MKITRGLTLVGVALLTFLFPMAALADCGPGEPGCEFDLPQSVEVNPAPESGAGESVELDDPGAFQPVEIGAPMPVPAVLTPVPFPNLNSSSGGSHAPGGDVILDVPVRYQAPGDVTCGVQALGMAMDGLIGGKGAASSAISSFLRENGMMYDFGTGVEELAYTAQSFGYEGSVPFHGWGMDELRGELAEGRSVVVSLGANGDHEPGHMVTVTGISADGRWVYYNDPTLGKQVVSRAEFERMWGSQGNSGVAVRREVPAGEGEAGAAPWVALAAGLMAAVSGAGLGGLREGVGGALMGSSGASGKKKRAKNYNDDGGTMSLKKAHKRARRKRKARRKKRRKRKKRKNRRSRRGRGGVKVDAKEVGQEEDPPKPQPVETPVPTGTEDPESTATPEPGSDLGLTTTHNEPWMPIFKRLPEGIEPVTTPEPEPVPTPTPTAEEMESARAKRLAFAEQEFLRFEPLEYIRHNVYWANGIDYYQYVEDKEDNPLSEELINDNERYPAGVRPAIMMNSADEQNVEFLELLDLETEYIPNYEPVYLEELKRRYPEDFERALDFVSGARSGEDAILDKFWKKYFKLLLTKGYE